MAFLKWNKQDSSDDNMDYDIQSLLSELEAASYIADKRSISKDLLVIFMFALYNLGCC